MDQPLGYSSIRLPWYARLPLGLGGCLFLGLLATAACLEPASKGYGTHTQLPGLRECTFQTLTNGKWRCPSCGMTTSWAHLMRGNVAGAVRANIGGTLLAVLAAVSGPWMLVSGLRGRWFLGCPNEIVVASLGVGVVFVTLIDWSLRNFVL